MTWSGAERYPRIFKKCPFGGFLSSPPCIGGLVRLRGSVVIGEESPSTGCLELRLEVAETTAFKHLEKADIPRASAEIAGDRCGLLNLS
jgi:hypothetical protein